MALYGYYKQDSGLFIDNAGTWENHDASQTANEAFLVALGFKKLIAYKIIQDTYEYLTNDKFALQPSDEDVYRFVSDTEVKYISSEYVTDATFFVEIQMSSDYIY